MLAAAGYGAWAALMVAAQLLAVAVAQLYAYAFGLEWGLTLSAMLGGACLFAAFMMAGLRFLRVDSDDTPAAPEANAAAPPDHAQFQRPTPAM
jgi:hypothetical protein